MIGGKVEFRVEGLFIDLPTAAVKSALNSLANKLEMLLVQLFEFIFWFRVKDAYPLQWNHAVKQLVPLPLVHSLHLDQCSGFCPILLCLRCHC